MAQGKAKKRGGSAGTKAQGTRQTNPANRLSRGQKAVVVLLVVLLALSSVAGLVASYLSSSSSTTSTTTSFSTIEEVDAAYEDLVSDLEQTVADDPSNQTALLNLGRYYLSWGINVTTLATVDSETSHANELYSKAISAFDTYLESNEDASVSTDRAIALYYSGETSAATSALEEVTATYPDYAPAWADLGLFYEVAGDDDAAREAYERAIEADPDDEEGAKSYAEERIEALDSSSSESTVTTTGTSLSDALSSLSGIGV